MTEETIIFQNGDIKITNLGASSPQNKQLDKAEILLLLEKLKDQLR